jgi:hypothetical protein
VERVLCTTGCTATSSAATTREREIGVNTDSTYGWGIGIFRRYEVGMYYNGTKVWGLYRVSGGLGGEIREKDVCLSCSCHL